MASVTIAAVRKRFGSVEVLHGVDIEIADGSFTVLVGPSGCGKSTLLRMIAGLEQISDGEIRIGERRVNELPPKQRDIAMVFQNYALYPHMTVRENLAFALMLAKADAATVEAKVSRAAAILGLTELLQRYPRQLSGGQRQRVAMGRAIVRDPQVFLFDEPLSNLDAQLRVAMRTEIKELHQRLGTTSVYVTHDQIEAMTMGDQIVVMRDGRVEQRGSPLALYDRPANQFVAGFIGSPAMNFLPATLRRSAAGAELELGDGTRLPAPPDSGGLDGQPVIFGTRPEHLSLSSEGGIRTEVVVVEPTGADTFVACRMPGSTQGKELQVLFHDRHAFAPGSTIRLQPDLQRAHVFDAGSGRRLA
ncbi:ABC transporter ATP-binding protein [Aquabacterium sp.]|uniref:ABC transporter ATP-binding protein n=1 Tax=Aquabacterium sp. TaxID=1872578 RepID=UPI003783202B